MGAIMNLQKYKRIVNKKMIQECRKPYCEYCGGRANCEPHHVHTVGSGGGDIRENLIQLCRSCYIKAHSGSISKTECIAIITEREGITTDEVYVINRRAKGYDVC